VGDESLDFELLYNSAKTLRIDELVRIANQAAGKGFALSEDRLMNIDPATYVEPEALIRRLITYTLISFSFSGRPMLSCCTLSRLLTRLHQPALAAIWPAVQLSLPS